MTTYLLQVLTDNFEEQLKTEVTANGLDVLLHEAKDMVKNNPSVVGKAYRVFKYENINGKMIPSFLKESVIEGCN